MKATCLECDQIVDADEETCMADASSYEDEIMCPCPGDYRCEADVPGADDSHNDPRHGQAADINRRNER